MKAGTFLETVPGIFKKKKLKLKKEISLRDKEKKIFQVQVFVILYFCIDF